MAIGPGKYDALATYVREQAHAAMLAPDRARAPVARSAPPQM